MKRYPASDIFFVFSFFVGRFRPERKYALKNLELHVLHHYYL